eukprot:m.252 g.252  ORF g.252 m.252 type:complete len:288 (-) comp155_c0_seq1:37-900(-)
MDSKDLQARSDTNPASARPHADDHSLTEKYSNFVLNIDPKNTTHTMAASERGGLLERMKDRVSDLFHGHENPDKDSAFPTSTTTTRADAPFDSMASGARSDRSMPLERSDGSNARTGGSVFSKDKSHDDNGTLPFALDRGVQQQSEPKQESLLEAATRATRSLFSSDKDMDSTKNDPAMSHPASSSDKSMLPPFSSSSSSTINPSIIDGAAAPVTGTAPAPHPAAENTSDFSFWQPPSDAPVAKGGHGTGQGESDTVLGASMQKEDPEAYANRVSEKSRLVTTWEGK